MHTHRPHHYTPIATEYLHKTLARLLEDDIYQLLNAKVLSTNNFLQWPASVTHHHVYAGGLIIHTAEVLRYALAASSPFDSKIDITVLCVSVLLHDYAKIWDYEWRPGRIAKDGMYCPGAWAETPYRRLIRHVSGSHAFFTRLFYETELLEMVQYENIEHCILSHHGMQECGSPVEPQTIEARLIHNADMMSARFGTHSKDQAEVK